MGDAANLYHTVGWRTMPYGGVPNLMVTYHTVWCDKSYSMVWGIIPYGVRYHTVWCDASYRIVAYPTLWWRTIRVTYNIPNVPYVVRITYSVVMHHTFLRILHISYHTILLKQSTNAKTPKRSKNHKDTLKSQKTTWAGWDSGCFIPYHTTPYTTHWKNTRSWIEAVAIMFIPESQGEKFALHFLNENVFLNFHNITLSLQE